MPDPGSAAPPTREQVFAWMAETGSTIAQASGHFGVPVGTIKSWRSRNPGEAPPVAQPQPRTQPPPATPARVAPDPPTARSPTPPPARPPPTPKPNAAELLPPDDRADLVALARSIRRRCKRLDDLAHAELDRERPDTKRLDDLARSSRASAAELESLLKAHPGLMALVDNSESGGGDEAAARIGALLEAR